jgi:hypothetical protein
MILIEKYLIHFKIYCDLDGVLTDFLKQANKIHPNWETLCKKDKKYAWEKLMETGAEKFWSTMDWTEDGKELWKFIKGYNPIILTAIPKTCRNEAIIGKREWIAKNIGWEFVSSSIITDRNQKRRYSGLGSVLIDDKRENISDWESSKGIGILHTSTPKTISELKRILL